MADFNSARQEAIKLHEEEIAQKVAAAKKAIAENNKEHLEEILNAAYDFTYTATFIDFPPWMMVTYDTPEDLKVEQNREETGKNAYVDLAVYSHELLLHAVLTNNKDMVVYLLEEKEIPVDFGLMRKFLDSISGSGSRDEVFRNTSLVRDVITLITGDEKNNLIHYMFKRLLMAQVKVNSEQGILKILDNVSKHLPENTSYYKDFIKFAKDYVFEFGSANILFSLNTRFNFNDLNFLNARVDQIKGFNTDKKNIVTSFYATEQNARDVNMKYKNASSYIFEEVKALKNTIEGRAKNEIFFDKSRLTQINTLLSAIEKIFKSEDASPVKVEKMIEEIVKAHNAVEAKVRSSSLQNKSRLVGEFSGILTHLKDDFHIPFRVFDQSRGIACKMNDDFTVDVLTMQRFKNSNIDLDQGPKVTPPNLGL